jgi:glutamate racemase
MDGDQRPIGIFDSGVGGLSVLQALQALLPHEDCIYLADQAHFPYGPRSADDVRALTAGAVRLLQAEGAKLVVIACNTASSAALQALRRELELPIVGIEPAVKPACALSRTGRVGVLATNGTAQGQALRALILRVAGTTQVVTSPAADLVDLVERGALDGPATEAAVAAALAPLVAAGVDVVALGCTHYAFLRPLVERQLGPDVTVLEPSDAVARQVVRVLEQRGQCTVRAERGTVRYRSTGDAAPLEAAALRLLGGPHMADEEVAPVGGRGKRLAR